MNRPPSCGQHLQDRQLAETFRPPRLARPQAHLLAGRLPGPGRPGVQQPETLQRQIPRRAQVRRRLRFQKQLHLAGERFDFIQPQRQRHPSMRAHRIHRQRETGGPAVDCRLLEKESATSAGRFHFAVSPLGDLQLRCHRCCDSAEFACLLERVEKGGKGAVGHGRGHFRSGGS